MNVAFGIEVEKAFRFGMQVHRQLHGQGQEREGESRRMRRECSAYQGRQRLILIRDMLSHESVRRWVREALLCSSGVIKGMCIFLSVSSGMFYSFKLLK